MLVVSTDRFAESELSRRIDARYRAAQFRTNFIGSTRVSS